MNKSFILPLYGEEIVLTRDLAGVLNILRDSTLHARCLKKEASAIVSNIPTSSWAQAYKLTVYSNNTVGSLAKIMKEIENLGINILAFWASALDHEGAGYSTSIIELPGYSPNPLQSTPDADSRDPQDFVEKLTTALQRASEQRGYSILSDSALFRHNNLNPILLEPLRFLHNYKKLTQGQDDYELKIENWTLKLGNSEKSLRRALTKKLRRRDTPRQALITPLCRRRLLQADPNSFGKAFPTDYYPTSDRSVEGRGF